MDAVNNISRLKQRALSLMGESVYNEAGSDVPSAQVDSWFDAVLREFLQTHDWEWSAVTSEVAPSSADVLVLHWVRDGEYRYTPVSVTTIPDTQPRCQLAFCYLLAARVAACVTSRMDMVGNMEQQYERYLAEARYPDNYEKCLDGRGALTHYYTR